MCASIEKLYKEDVDDALTSRLPLCKALFGRYSGKCVLRAARRIGWTDARKMWWGF